MTRGETDPDNYPPTRPAVDGLNADRLGRLWVRHYEYGETLPKTYSLFEVDGQLLGEVEVLTGVKILKIGDDYVPCLAKDEFDV